MPVLWSPGQNSGSFGLKGEDDMQVLWVIPARAGSKGIPDKNIKPLAGLPLLAYRIKSALQVAKAEDIIVSTDSEAYMEVARSYQASVPYRRDIQLAGDLAKSEDVVMEAIQWAEKAGKSYQAIGLLQPTSPFVSAAQLKRAVELLAEEEADSIIAVKESRPNTIYIQQKDKYLEIISRRIAASGTLRRQDVQREITPSGGLYIAKWQSFKENKTFYTPKALAYVLPEVNSVDIDEDLDWKWAEFLIEAKVIDIPELFS